MAICICMHALLIFAHAWAIYREWCPWCLAILFLLARVRAPAPLQLYMLPRTDLGLLFLRELRPARRVTCRPCPRPPWPPHAYGQMLLPAARVRVRIATSRVSDKIRSDHALNMVSALRMRAQEPAAACSCRSHPDRTMNIHVSEAWNSGAYDFEARTKKLKRGEPIRIAVRQCLLRKAVTCAVTCTCIMHMHEYTCAS